MNILILHGPNTNLIGSVSAKNGDQITKVFATKKVVESFNLDPQLETADINLIWSNFA